MSQLGLLALSRPPHQPHPQLSALDTLLNSPSLSFVFVSALTPPSRARALNIRQAAVFPFSLGSHQHGLLYSAPASHKEPTTTQLVWLNPGCPTSRSSKAKLPDYDTKMASLGLSTLRFAVEANQASPVPVGAHISRFYQHNSYSAAGAPSMLSRTTIERRRLGTQGMPSL